MKPLTSKYHALAAIAAAPLFMACVDEDLCAGHDNDRASFDEADDDADPDTGDASPVSVAGPALLGAERTETYTYSGWTPFTSEESPPVSCDPGSNVTAVRCSGRNCDNIRLHCSPGGDSTYGVSWTTYFSEEGTNSRICPANSWVTGIACSGSYCDKISLQCTYFTPPGPQWPPKYPPVCQWTGWMSEENGGTLWFNFGKVRGVQCSGSYCDNKRYYLCL